jgi:hypothetical protein
MSRLGRVLEMGQRANPDLIMVRKSEDRDFTAFKYLTRSDGSEALKFKNRRLS